MASEDRLNLIRDSIVTRVQGVTGIGRVYNFLRWASSEQAFNSMMMTSGVIHSWQITRLNTQERWLTTGEVWRAHTFLIQGFYGLLDEAQTELTFQNVVERVAMKFRSKDAWTLSGLVESTAPYIGEMASASVLQGAIGGIQVEAVDHRSVNSKLCHSATLKLGVQDQPEFLG